jgi:hypothetical protein
MRLKELIRLCEHYTTLGFESQLQLQEMLAGDFSDINNAAYDIIKDFLEDASSVDDTLAADIEAFFARAEA